MALITRDIIHNKDSPSHLPENSIQGTTHDNGRILILDQYVVDQVEIRDFPVLVTEFKVYLTRFDFDTLLY